MARPEHPAERIVIGCHGLHRNDSETSLVVVTAEGIDGGTGPLAFEAIEKALTDAAKQDHWDDWHGG